MRNALLIIAEVIISYAVLLLLHKKYKTDGLYVYAIIATFISCIMNLKQIDIMSVPVPTGFGVTTTLIIAGNIITQRRGTEETKGYIGLIIITALISCCFLNLTGLMESSNYNEIANKSYNSIFVYNLRIYMATIISVGVSVFLSSKLYYLLKRLKNKIFFSNIFSIIIVEFIENILFVLIAYLFDYEIINIILCIVFRYTIKTIIGLLGTVSIYIANKSN